MRELGERLKRHRLDRGITLDDVQSATKIRLRYLNALEEGQFDVIPGEVYLKGFLRMYADYLGLDGLGVLREYQELREQRYREAMQAEQEGAEGDGMSASEGVEAPGGGTAPQPPPPEVATSAEGRDEPPVPSYRPLEPIRRSGSSRRWVLPVAVVGLLLAALAAVTVWVAGSGGRGEGLAQRGGTEAQPVTGQAVPAADERAPAGGNGQSGPSGARAIASIELEVIAHQDCWLRVLADGERVYEGTMIPGESRVWKAGERLQVRLGNARGVDLIVNGHELAPPESDVIERVFTPESVAQLIGQG